MLVVLVFLFIFSRVINLGSFMPIFLDEALYAGWLRQIQSAGDWLLPLKQFGWEPFSIWVSGLINLVVNHSLVSLRLTAVLFGLLSAITAYLIFRSVYSRLFSFLASCIYLFSPIIFLHDRLGLRGDSAVNFFFLLTILGIIKRKQILIGLAIALGLMTKTTAVILPLLAALTLNWLPLVAVLFPLAFFWLTHTLALVVNKQTVFMTSAGWLSQFKANLIQSLPWLMHYLTWPVVLLVVIGIVFAWIHYRRISKILTIALAASYLFMLITAKIFFPRYLLITYQSALLLAGIGLIELIKLLPKKLRWMSLVFFLPSLLFCYKIATSFTQASWPEIERWQYVTGWPSGYALPELVSYLKTNTPTVLVTQPDDLIKLGIEYYWPDHQMIMTETATPSAYFVTNIYDQLPENMDGQLIKEFPRPENKSAVKLYKLQ